MSMSRICWPDTRPSAFTLIDPVAPRYVTVSGRFTSPATCSAHTASTSSRGKRGTFTVSSTAANPDSGSLSRGLMRQPGLRFSPGRQERSSGQVVPHK